ncbi:Mg chelatase, subunit ChlI [Alkalihalophilus pseudofirmus OF4]|uniref:Mg chelatase, subunit ChlI n=2 Tax=Alkalihalophilus pseudofirmus TaxID=79885 RepID=D3G067_ALKPO|nr:Mg chelatase, subunit ChlI [Alkalihalophilus pseudofirmus OF4]
MAEFQKKTLDMLRQPMESGRVTISRVHSTVTYPASFQLIGAMNPCPCGYLGSNVKYCSCTDKQVQSYRARVSGPVLDRVDILLHLIPVNLDREEEGTLSSEELRVQVERARERQYERYGAGVSNAKVPFDVLSECSPLTTSQRQMVAQVSSKQQWSNRVQIKIIRLARTISDLRESEVITDEALWEAMSLRRLNQSSSKLSAREL